MILRADPDQSSPNKTELGLRLSCNLRKTVVFIEIQLIGINVNPLYPWLY